MRKIMAIWMVAVMLAISITGCVAVVRTRPPAARYEIRTVAPSPDSVWIDGYWQFQRGDWVWIAGHWGRRPAAGAEWVPGHWIETRKGWEWIPGHWRR